MTDANTKSQRASEKHWGTLASSRGWYVWLALGLTVSGLALGAALGTLTLLLRPEAEPKRTQASDGDALGEQSRDEVSRGDEHLLAQEYGAALNWYRSRMGPEPAPLVQFRVALCLDGLGKSAEAFPTYSELAQRFPGTPLEFACQVNMARLEYRQGNSRAARQRLARALLQAPEILARSPAMLGAIRLEFSAWSILEQTQRQGPDPWEPELVQAPWPLESPESSWVWLLKIGEHALRPWPVPYEKWAFDRTSTPEETLVTWCIPQCNLIEAVQRLLAEAQLQLSLSNAASSVLQQRQLRDVRIPDWPLGEVLSLLASVADCVWYRWHDHVYFLTREELSEPKAVGSQESIAQMVEHSQSCAVLATLRRLLLQTQEAPLSASHRIFWLQGWCYYLLEQRREAITWWERLLLRWPNQPEAFYASFNLGVLAWQEGELHTAKRMWLQAVDHAPAHNFASSAYLYAARAELELLQVDSAILWLRRAALTTSSDSTRRVAWLLLAASYLYLEHAPAAHDLLVRHRREFPSEPFRSYAAFLDALARAQLASNRRPLRRESEDLVAALLQVHDWRWLEPLGPLLAGQTWMRLQLPEQALLVYRSVLPRARAKWREELLLAYGEVCLALGLHADLRRHAAELLKSSDVSHVAAAHWLLARCAFDQADYWNALEHARQVLLRPGKVSRQAVLYLMGQAYNALGDVQRAAHCFAGQFPES
ncbi:MAG: tetratricopeptide repeat protein [Gemmatales bacterium]|nr:tetratricopeptide repeat protein [Gemmatales bacterium]MDW7995284.1 tetratricopeptide repeat protein [Gemmatales bacterium]